MWCRWHKSNKLCISAVCCALLRCTSAAAAAAVAWSRSPSFGTRLLHPLHLCKVCVDRKHKCADYTTWWRRWQTKTMAFVRSHFHRLYLTENCVCVYFICPWTEAKSKCPELKKTQQIHARTMRAMLASTLLLYINIHAYDLCQLVCHYLLRDPRRRRTILLYCTRQSPPSSCSALLCCAFISYNQQKTKPNTL